MAIITTSLKCGISATIKSKNKSCLSFFLTGDFHVGLAGGVAAVAIRGELQNLALEIFVSELLFVYGLQYSAIVNILGAVHLKTA